MTRDIHGGGSHEDLWKAITKVREDGCNYRPVEEAAMARLERMETNWDGVRGEIHSLRTELVREVSAIRTDMSTLVVELRETISANVTAFLKTVTWISGFVLFVILSYLAVQIYAHVYDPHPTATPSVVVTPRQTPPIRP